MDTLEIRLGRDFLLHRSLELAKDRPDVVSDITLFDLGGYDVAEYVETPSSYLSIAGITNSKTTDNPEGVSCLLAQYQVGREPHINKTGSFKSYGHILGTNLMVIIPYEPYCVDIIGKQLNGELIPEILIKTTHIVGGKNESLKEEKFVGCRIIESTHCREWMFLSIHFRQISIVINRYKPDGTADGSSPTYFRFDEDVPTEPDAQ